MVAQNTVGYGAEFPQQTATSLSNTRVIGPSFNIIASAGAGGTITPSGTVTVGRTGSQTFTITPNAGFRTATVLVDNVNNPTAVSTGTYTFTNVTAAHTISATFTQSQATITSSAGTGGTISPNGAQTVPINGSQIYTITPNNGYVRNQVLVDGINNPAAVTSGTYTFTNVLAPHTIAATFTATGFTITPSAGPNGSISPSTPQTVTSGGNSPAFTITPNAGFRITQVLVDGVNDPAAVTSGHLHVHECDGEPHDRRDVRRTAGRHCTERRGDRQPIWDDQCDLDCFAGARGGLLRRLGLQPDDELVSAQRGAHRRRRRTDQLQLPLDGGPACGRRLQDPRLVSRRGW